MTLAEEANAVIREATQTIVDMREQIERLTRERDEAREALADAGTLMDRTIAMSYCTSAEMPEKDHTHALPSAMLGVIRERDEARERAASLSRELLTAIRARDSYRASAERLAKALRHCARELQYVLDADPCERGEIHQSGEAKACVALAESLLGPMRGWPEEPNAGMLAALAEVGE